MARVTVEDCIDKIPNRFELVMTAAQRARKIGSGAALLVERDNDKNPVVSLREIAEEKINIEEVQEELTRNYQRILPQDDTEDNIDLMDGEEEWSTMAKQSTEGVYSDEEIADDDDGAEPSLSDIAGNASE